MLVHVLERTALFFVSRQCDLTELSPPPLCFEHAARHGQMFNYRIAAPSTQCACTCGDVYCISNGTARASEKYVCLPRCMDAYMFVQHLLAFTAVMMIMVTFESAP